MNSSTQRKIAEILFSNISNDNLATKKERSLVKKIWDVHDISKVSISDTQELKLAFKKASLDDAYLISPTYYMLTGRRGLWLYKHATRNNDEKTACLFCLHPNIKDTVIIFPPFGCNTPAAISRLIDKVSIEGINFQIGRIAKESGMVCELNKFLNGRIVEKNEDVLDWAFPVHTIDCNKLLAQKGGKYKRIRQVMKKFNATSPTIREINFTDDFSSIKKMSEDWEKSNQHYDKYNVDFNKYFETLIDVAVRAPSIGLKGIIISIDGIDSGFSIWEHALNKEKIANLFASQVSNFELDSLSAYLTVKSVEHAFLGGAKYMCLGGSENYGMDRYKRGFVPEQSKDLITVEITP